MTAANEGSANSSLLAALINKAKSL